MGRKTSNKENSTPARSNPPRASQLSKKAEAAKKAAQKEAKKKATSTKLAANAQRASTNLANDEPEEAPTTKKAKTSASQKNKKKAPSTTTGPAKRTSPETSTGLAVGTLEMRIQQLERENRTLRENTQAASVEYKIPQPEKPQYNLQMAMGLKAKPRKYNRLRALVRRITRESAINISHCWRKQDFVKLARIKQVVLEQESYFFKFEHEWPIAEFIKRYLKNARAYQSDQDAKEAAAKKAKTRGNQEKDDEDEEEGGESDKGSDGNNEENNGKVAEKDEEEDEEDEEEEEEDEEDAEEAKEGGREAEPDVGGDEEGSDDD